MRATPHNEVYKILGLGYSEPNLKKMKIALPLFCFFFLSAVLFGQMFSRGRIEPDEDSRVNRALALREERNRDVATDFSRTENDDFPTAKRGTFIGISEDRPPAIARPVDSKQIFAFQEQAESTATFAIDIAEIITYLRDHNLLDNRDNYNESINNFFDQKFKTLEVLDEDQKADLKREQAGIMADDLARKGESVFSSNSLVRRNTLTISLMKRSWDNTATRIKSRSEALLGALQAVAHSELLNVRRTPTATAQGDGFSISRMKAVRENEHASTEESILSQTIITAAKSGLEKNRLAFEQLASNGSFQEEARDWHEVMRKRDAEFLLEESISNQAAEAKAKENKEFLHQKIKELEEIQEGGRSEFLEDDSIMERLNEMIEVLQKRSDAYQQLEEIYKGMSSEERISLLQLLKPEQASSSISDQRIILGTHGRVRIEEAPANLEDVDNQDARTGIMLASLEILERFGPYALHRFNNFFHTEMVDHAPLAVEKLKEFVTIEEGKERERTAGFKSLFLSKDSQGIKVLNKIYQESQSLGYKGSEQEKTDQDALICLDGSQVNFNPFAARFSKKYLVEEAKMPHGAVLAIEEALRNGEIEFAKSMTALKRHDVANYFFTHFNDAKKRLTVSELVSFFKLESEKQERWPDRLYYGCFSKLYDKLPEQYQINRQGWSIFQAIVSAVKGQPVVTQLGKEVGLPLWNTDISTAISVVMTWGTTWLGDETRPSRKPPVINEENIEEGSSRRNYDLREAADEFSDNMVLMELHHLMNRGDVKPAFEKRKKFVTDWLARRPDIGELNISAEEKEIDAAFPKLGEDIEDSITAAHQKIESQGKEISHSHYFSQEEATALQASFKEREAEFLSLEARLPQGLQGMEEIWHSLKTSSDFFSEQAAEIKAKAEGGEKAQKNEVDLQDLTQRLTQIQDAYEQLADAYLLKYKLQKREQDKLENQKQQIVIQRPPFFKEMDELLQADPSNTVDPNSPVNVSIRHATTAEAQEKTLALIQVFIENGYGLDAVRRFNESFPLRAAERFIKVQELRDFIAQEKESLQQKGINTRSIYLPSHYSETDLYHAPDTENDKVIRSSGRQSFYNSFLSKELPEDYLIDERSTAEEGVKHALELLVRMDFFKKVNPVNQQEILWSYEKQFQSKAKKPLTVAAFKNFIEKEKNKSQQWSSRLYYAVRNPSVIRVLCSTVMSALSGYRYQPGFEALQWEDKFEVTYATDIGYERYGNYREQESYEKHIVEMIKQMTAAREESLPTDDAYFQLQQIESDLKNASGKNYIAWRAAVDEYAEKADKIRQLKEAINSSSVEKAFDQLEQAQQSITQLSDDFKESPIFSKKDLARIQKSVANFKEKFLLQQARSAYDEGEVEMTQFMAANNARLFQQQAPEIEVKIAAATGEIGLLEKKSDAILLAAGLRQLHEGYGQLANAYASVLLPDPFKKKEKGAEDLAQQSFHLNPNEREFLNEGKDDDVISSTRDAKIMLKDKPEGVLSEKEKQAYRRGINLVELSLQHCYDDEVIRQFQKRFQIKRMQGNPLQLGELRKFLESLEKQGIKKFFYLAPAHSLEQLLNTSYKNVGGVIKARRLNSVDPIDEIQGGRTKTLSELEKINWYQGLTGLEKNRVLETFKERYIKPQVVLIPWKKWIGLRDPEHLEPLTVDAFRTFVDEQKQISANWSIYYKILDTPAAAVAIWNVVTGGLVLARINNDIVRCHSTIPLTTHFFGITLPQHALYVPCLALLPTPFHLLPSFFIAYASNYGGEQFNKERQLPLTGVSQQANLYRLKQAQLRERYESVSLNIK